MKFSFNTIIRPSSKWSFLFASFFLCVLSYAQVSTVLDAPFIRERYATHNDLGYTFYKLETFKGITPEQSALIEKYPVLYPESPLFSEDVYWCKRVWRDIPLDKRNEHLMPDSEHKDFEDPDIVNVIEQKMLDSTVTMFTTDEFLYELKQDEARQRILTLLPTSIRIKEDWYYNRKTGELKSSIIGIALMSNDSPIAWMYYPELKLNLGFDGFYASDWSVRESDQYYMSWKDCMDHHYFASTISRQVFEYGNTHIAPIETEVGFHFPELDAPFEVMQILEDVKWYARTEGMEKKSVTLKCIDGTSLTGELYNLMLQGEWLRKSPEGKVLTRISFMNNIPVGNYEHFDAKGYLVESGKYDYGLREGIWITQDASKHKLSERRYAKGVMDGIQTFFYPNGKKACEFNYSKAQPNGAFARWYPDGFLLDSGELENGYMSGLWTVNIRIDEQWQAIISKYALHNMFANAADDGVLTLKMVVTLEYGDPNLEQWNQCARNICVKRSKPDRNEWPEVE